MSKTSDRVIQGQARTIVELRLEIEDLKKQIARNKQGDKMKNWTINEITGEIFFRGELILFSCNLIIDHFGYAGFDMCLQVNENDYFEFYGGHGSGLVDYNVPNDDLSEEHKTMNKQLEYYLNNYDYTLDEFLKLPQNRQVYK